VKFHRVERKLPAGVGTKISAQALPVDSLFSDSFFGPFFESFKGPLSKHTERFTSTEPMTLTLEVPENAAAETARILRELADELTGEKR